MVYLQILKQALPITYLHNRLLEFMGALDIGEIRNWYFSMCKQGQSVSLSFLVLISLWGKNHINCWHESSLNCQWTDNHVMEIRPIDVGHLKCVHVWTFNSEGVYITRKSQTECMGWSLHHIFLATSDNHNHCTHTFPFQPSGYARMMVLIRYYSSPSQIPDNITYLTGTMKKLKSR